VWEDDARVVDNVCVNEKICSRTRAADEKLLQAQRVRLISFSDPHFVGKSK
jgi:hypothetical protein